MGSEAYRPARLFYKTVKAAAKEGAEDAGRIAKDIAYHFKKKTTSKNDADNPDNTDNTDRADNRIQEPSVETK